MVLTILLKLNILCLIILDLMTEMLQIVGGIVNFWVIQMNLARGMFCSDMLIAIQNMCLLYHI